MNPREHGKRSIDNETRSALKHQRPAVIWLTGLSGAGKSTIANALELALFEQKKHTFLLDGDDLRLGLCRNLGYSDEDRTENIRRIAEVAKILLEAGLIVIVATISPFSRDRRLSGTYRHRAFHRGLCRHAALGMREKRSQRPVQESTLGQDRKLHRDRLDLRNARTAEHNDRYTFRRPRPGGEANHFLPGDEPASLTR